MNGKCREIDEECKMDGESRKKRGGTNIEIEMV